MSQSKTKEHSQTNNASRRRFIDNAGHMDPAHRDRLLKQHATATSARDPLPFRSQGRVEPILGEFLAAQTVTSMTSGEQESPESTNTLEGLTEVYITEGLNGPTSK
jgi:hypothetical protein